LFKLATNRTLAVPTANSKRQTAKQPLGRKTTRQTAYHVVRAPERSLAATALPEASMHTSQLSSRPSHFAAPSKQAKRQVLGPMNCLVFA